MTKSLITYILLTLNCAFLFGQNYSNEEIVYFKNQIGDINENKAKEDLKGNKILILVLISNFTTQNPQLTGGQIKSIEKRFGFEYDYRFFDIPQDFLHNKNQEYNDVVFEYLDSINNIDTKNEIETEFSRYMIENNSVSNTEDKKLKKVVRKEFRKEDRTHRKLIFSAEKVYRDRDFEKAFEIFTGIENRIMTPKGKCFILSSKYHSLMNLERFEEAYDLLNLDKNNCIDKRLKYKNLP